MQQPEHRMRGLAHAAGVSLAELVLVLLLLGVLAAVVLPRLDARALQILPVAEQIAAEIRHAQSLAMTRGETHVFETDGASYSISSASQSQVQLSNGALSGSLRGLTVGGTGSIAFAPRFGQPDGAASITISDNGSSVTVTVSGETGYVQIIE